MKNTKIIFIPLIIILFSFGKASCDIYNQNLFVISGEDTQEIRQAIRQESVFFIEIPESYSKKIFLRIFDADIGGAYDKWTQDSEAQYYLYGKDGIEKDTESGTGAAPLLSLNLKKDIHYNNQWRTFGELNLSQGQNKNGKTIFRLTAGISGSGINKYKIFISSENKLNKPAKDVVLYSYGINIQPGNKTGADRLKVTQLSFEIPENTEYLNIYNAYGAKMFFETHVRNNIPLAHSKDGSSAISKIILKDQEKGSQGAVIIPLRNNGNIGLEINDNNGKKIPFIFPDLVAVKNNLPVPAIKKIPLSDCTKIVLDATESKDPDNDELKFAWFFQDGTVKKGSRITHDFLNPGTYQVVLEVKDNSGFVSCADRLTDSIEINSPPAAEITAPILGIPNENIDFDASKSSDDDGKIVQYLWDFGDGTKAGAQKTRHSYSQPGQYTVSLIIEDDGKGFCTRNKAVHRIKINTKPIAHIQIQEMASENEIVNIDPAKSIDSDGEIIKYEWDFGDGVTSEEKSVSHQWEKPGTYTVRLKVTDDSNTGNSTAEDQKTIIINAPPVPDFKFRDVAAANEEIEFDAKAAIDPDGGIINYLWELGDGNTKQGKIIHHKYEKPGTYSGKLIVTDNSQMANNTAVKDFSLRVNHPPVPNPGEDRVINSTIAEFDAGKSYDNDDEIIKYLWDFGDSSSGTGKKVSHSYSSPGEYKVKLTVRDNSKTISSEQSETINIRVNHPPIADAGRNRLIAAGESVFFDGGFSQDPDGRIVSFEWFINNNIVKNREAGLQFDFSGIYEARLKVRDNDGAEDFDSILILVNAAPSPCISPVNRFAPEQSALFDASCSHDPDGQIIKAVWNFGDGSEPESGFLLKHKYKNPGRYKVTLTVQDDSSASNNTKSIAQIIEVNYPPIAAAGSDIHTCSQNVGFDGSQTVDADGDFLTFNWDFGDGKTGQGMVVTHAYDNPGIYPVSLTADDGKGLANSISRSDIIAYVNAPPAAKIKVSHQSVCANEPVFFDGGDSSDPEGGLLRYMWDLGNGETSEKRNPVKTFKQGGDYKIHLTVFDESNLPCNKSWDQIMLHVIEAPVANAGPDRDVCANTPIQFDGSKSRGGMRLIKSYEWDFGDGNKSVGIKPNHVFSAPEKYPARYKVKLKITAAGDGVCENTSIDFANINVLQASEPGFESKEQGCIKETINFNAGTSKSSNGKITEYLWDFGDGNLASGPEPYHVYDKSGDYPVKLKITTDSGQTCNNGEITKIIRINDKPLANIRVEISDQAPISTESLNTHVNTLLRFSGADSKDPDRFIKDYEWNFGDTNKKTGAYVSHQYEKPGRYTLSLIVTDDSNTSCSQAEAVMEINVSEYPRILIKGPETACTNEQLTFSIPESEFEHREPVEWNFSDNTSGIGTEINKIFTKSGIYQIQAKTGGFLSLTKMVIIKNLPEISIPESIQGFPGDKLEINPLYKIYDDENLIFQWDMGDKTLINLEKFSHIYEKPGQFSVKLIVSADKGLPCQTKEYPVFIEILTPPQAEIKTQPEIIFSGGARDEVIFKSVIKENPEKWNTAWDFGDRQKAFGKTVKHTYSKPGKYKVVMTLSHVIIKKGVFPFSKIISVQKQN